MDNDGEQDLPRMASRGNDKVGPREIAKRTLWEVTSTFWDVMFNSIASSSLIPARARFLVYRALGVRAQHGRINSRCHFIGRRVSIGRACFINHRCFFDASGGITIGNKCHLAMDVLLVTSTHEIGPPEWRGGPNRTLPIAIGDGTWIGAGAKILPGVTIGPGCIIAAGAVVAADCEPNGLYAGVPAKLKRLL
jgi:maltose O-acetyltransferase